MQVPESDPKENGEIEVSQLTWEGELPGDVTPARGAATRAYLAPWLVVCEGNFRVATVAGAPAFMVFVMVFW
jgi:hypothetical protein